MTTIKAMQMRSGDKVVVDPAEGEPFEATVVAPLGWGLIHGHIDWRMLRASDNKPFTFTIDKDVDIELVEDAERSET